jgi:hypothetical protein
VIKQTITYTDFDDVEQTEDHYFHLSKSELIEMELAQEGGMANMLETIVKSGDSRKIIESFRDIISKAYGQRVEGSGTKFYKSETISKQFMESLAFDAFFTELLTNAQTAITFVNGVIPKDLAETAAKAAAASPDSAELPWANREPTTQELSQMSQAQLLEVYARRNAKQ